MEIWKDIEGYDGYQISTLGRVKSLKGRNERILKVGTNHKGYKYVMLSKNNVPKMFTVHKLVANAFIKNTQNKPQINHIDGNKANNEVGNLEYCTNRENQLHAFKTGLHKTKKINQYDLQRNFIKTWDNISTIKKELKIDISHIGQCCKNIRKTANGFIWEYKDTIK